jgi:hypothetical protein
MPETGVASHVALLQVFQQLVELQESMRILVDLGSSRQTDPQYGELKARGPRVDIWRNGWL